MNDVEPLEHRLNIFENLLVGIYNPEELSVYYVEFYSSNIYISRYKNLIDQAIRCYANGMNAIAIAGLVPVVEGCIMAMYKDLLSARIIKKAEKVDRVDGNKAKLDFKDFLHALTTHIAKEAICENEGVYNQRLGIALSFKNYISRKFWANSRNGNRDISNLVRHGILHGDYSDNEYSRPLNFCKLIIILNYIHFACAFIGRNGSIFRPEISSESTAYFKSLKH